jgi:putative ABC transport system permease protein
LLGIRLTIGATTTVRLIPALFLLGMMVGLAAGSYPAFFLSSFHPAKILKGTLRSGTANARFRRLLVGVQFIISIILIVGTSLIREQIIFMKNKTLGFNKDQVLVMEVLDRKVFQSRDAIKSRLKQVPGVLAVSATQGVPGRRLMDNMPVVPEGFSSNESFTMRRFCADADYLPALGIELAAGRNFSEDTANDRENSIILNETAVKKLGWVNPIGKTVKIPVSPIKMQPKTVVGVVRDFHVSSLREMIEPLCIENSPRKFNSFLVKAKTGNMSRLVDELNKAWKDIGTAYPYDFFFLDHAFDAQYRAEERFWPSPSPAWGCWACRRSWPNNGQRKSGSARSLARRSERSSSSSQRSI